MLLETLPPWKAKALELLPELNEPISEADNLMALWIGLQFEFADAYDPPGRPDLIRRIYEFAWWCFEQEQTEKDDLASAVACAFLEHIPEHHKARLDMPRWFTREEVLAMRGIFSYHLGAVEYDRLVAEVFPRERSNRAATREERKQNRQPRPWARPDLPANRPFRKR